MNNDTTTTLIGSLYEVVKAHTSYWEPLFCAQQRISTKNSTPPVDDAGNRFRFTSQILPPYLRKTKSIEELIPWLYLRGISTGDFSQALTALLRPDAPATGGWRWCPGLLDYVSSTLSRGTRA